MTETTTKSRARNKGNGLTIERVYTTPGVHPYDEVTWERRDVVQTNWKTGETVFEQRGVEFPSTWSVNASTIVTTKYFRGALGTEQRETSLRQLIDRVVRKYRAAGEENAYFATPADADTFEHELAWHVEVDDHVVEGEIEAGKRYTESDFNKIIEIKEPIIVRVGKRNFRYILRCE